MEGNSSWERIKLLLTPIVIFVAGTLIALVIGYLVPQIGEWIRQKSLLLRIPLCIVGALICAWAVWSWVARQTRDKNSAWLNFVISTATFVVIASLLSYYVGIFSFNATQHALRLPSPTESSLTSITMLSPTECWAVGYDGTILHFSNSHWTVDASHIPEPLFGVKMLSSRQGWAIGLAGVILHFDGNGWTEYPSGSRLFGGELASVTMLSPQDGWIVGGGIVGDGTTTSAILHFVGGAWTSYATLPHVVLSAVDFVSQDEGWAVGRDTKGGIILHYVAGSWSKFDIPRTNSLTGIAMVSGTDGWAVGVSGVILHYNGTQWTLIHSPTTQTLASITMLPLGNEGWTVGAEGTILHYSAGTWQPETSHTNQFLTSVTAMAMSGSTISWAVGASGTILRYVNGNWKQM